MDNNKKLINSLEDQDINSMSIKELNKLKDQLTKIDPNNSLIETLNKRIDDIHQKQIEKDYKDRFKLATKFMTSAKKVYDIILDTNPDSEYANEYINIFQDINDIISTRLNRFIYLIKTEHVCLNYNSKVCQEYRKIKADSLRDNYNDEYYFEYNKPENPYKNLDEVVDDYDYFNE